ncbi:galactose oxidase-like domain-containing protein [Nocardia sp. NPDC058480]|uniref:galactose oxidase-like domain-containing protein n=1 Tax=unclassified Nocardia TaxID=2637762 RepID=UPI003662B64B
MPWNTNIIDSEILAIHASFLNFDQLVYFGGDQHDPEFNKTGNIDAIRLFDCNSFSIHKVKLDLFDTFCSGHALTYGGILLVAGGTRRFPDKVAAGPHHIHFPGLRDSAVIRLDENAKYQAKRVASMNRGLPYRPPSEPPAEHIDHRGDTGGRWYPTLVTLPSGNVLALNGHPGTDDAWHTNYIPEVFTPNPLPNGRWHRLGDPENVMTRAHFEQYDAVTLYPRAYVIPGGKVLIASPSKGYKTVTLAIDESAMKGQYQELGDFAPGPTNRYGAFWESSVLLPMRWDSTEARVLITGAEDSWICTVPSGPGIPLWRRTAPRQLAGHPRRIHGQAILLPNLKVLLVGGVAGTPPDAATLDATAVRTPEIYDPEVNRDGATPGNWKALTHASEKQSQVRNYHSTAILMRDGRVWVAGGDKDGAAGIANANLTIEIYEPSYFGNPNRPEILAAPNRWLTGTTFEVESTQVSENNIEHVIIVRCGSVTHAFNADQRLIQLGFNRIDGDRLKVTAPKDATIAPPGFYFMFTVNKQNLPSLGIKVYITEIPESDSERAWNGLFAGR